MGLFDACLRCRFITSGMRHIHPPDDGNARVGSSRRRKAASSQAFARGGTGGRLLRGLSPHDAAGAAFAWALARAVSLLGQVFHPAGDAQLIRRMGQT